MSQSLPETVSQWLAPRLPELEAALQDLVEVNSFTGNPPGGNVVGEKLTRLLDIEGVTHEIIPSERFADHHVWRTRGRPGAAPVVLVGHLDTVFPPGTFEGYRVEGNLRRGPGVLDMKSGLLVVIWALRALAEAGALSRLPPIHFVVVSDEEVGSPESQPLLQKEAQGAQAALVFESGRARDAIITRRKGVGAVVAHAHGVAAHAGNHHREGRNAIWALSHFIDRAQRLTDYERGITVNVGKVLGGQGKNTVPDAAEAHLDMRFCRQEDADFLLEGLRAAAAAASEAVPGTRVELTGGVTRAPLERTEASAALLASYGACARAFGLGDGEADLIGGGSDASTTGSLGVPSIDGLGPRGSGFHTREECIEIDTFVPRVQALAVWLAKLAEAPTS